MNRIEFVESYNRFCDKVGLNSEQVIASAGGALLMLGLRDSTGDLDLDVSEDIYTVLGKGKPVKVSLMGEYVDYDDCVSLQVTPVGLETIVVGGVRIYSVKELIKQKKAMMDLPTRPLSKIEQDKLDVMELEKLI